MDFLSQGVEKLISSKMLLEGSNRRIHAVDRHAGMVSMLNNSVLKQIDKHFFNIYMMFQNFVLLGSRKLT